MEIICRSSALSFRSKCRSPLDAISERRKWKPQIAEQFQLNDCLATMFRRKLLEIMMVRRMQPENQFEGIASKRR